MSRHGRQAEDALGGAPLTYESIRSYQKVMLRNMLNTKFYLKKLGGERALEGRELMRLVCASASGPASRRQCGRPRLDVLLALDWVSPATSNPTYSMAKWFTATSATSSS